MRCWKKNHGRYPADDAGQDRAGPPVAATGPQEEQHRQRQAGGPPDRRRAQGGDGLRALVDGAAVLAHLRSLVVVGDRPGQHQPAPRVRPVGVEGLEVGVEVPRLVVVVPEAPQRVGDVRRAGVGRSPSCAGRRGRRRGTSRSTTRGRPRAATSTTEAKAGSGVADQGAEPRPADTRRTPGAHVPEQRHQAEHGDEVQPAPLGGAGHAEAEAGRAAARAASRARGRTGHRRRRRAAAASRARAQSRSTTQRAERRQRPEHQQRVEQRGAAVHVLQPVDGEQQPGDAAEQRRAEQPAADPARSSAPPGCRCSATMNRQPNGVKPNSCSPIAIIHLPPGGCTT